VCRTLAAVVALVDAVVMLVVWAAAEQGDHPQELQTLAAVVVEIQAQRHLMVVQVFVLLALKL
jgi:hypothetical protein